MAIKLEDNFRELPGVRQGRASNPMDGTTATEVFAKQSQQLGRGIQQAGGAIAEIVQAEQEKANKVRLNDAYNQATRIAHDLKNAKDTGYTSLKGDAAVKGIQGDDGSFRPIAETYGEKLNKELAQIRKGLGNDALAQQFDLLSGDMSTRFRNEAVSYEAEQANVYEQQVRDATIVTSANEASVIAPALTSTDPKTAAAARAKLEFHIGTRAHDAAKQTGIKKGLSGPELELHIQETLGKANEAVIAGLLESKDVASAKAFFELRRDDFTELQARDIKAKLDTAYSAVVAIAAVDTVIAANGGMNPSDRDIDIGKMHDALRETHKDNPEALKAARAELDYRFSIHERQQRESDAGSVSSVWNQLLGGQSIAAVEGSRAWLALPGDKRAALKSAWDNFQAGTVSDEMLGGFLDKLLDENYLADVSPAELQALIPFYGAQRVGQLGTAAKNVRAGRAGEQYKAALDQPNIPPALVDTLATASGLKPFNTAESNKGEADKAKAEVANLQTKVYQLAAQHQLATGKVIPPADMEAFLRGALAREGIRKTLNTFGPSAPVPGSAQAAAVAAYLQQRGLPPTVENQRKAMLDATLAGQLLVDE